MKTLKAILVMILITNLPFNGYLKAQEPQQGGGSGGGAEVLKPPKYADGIYVKENSVNRRFIPYTSLREADVMWSRRVWRNIDLKEKINHPLYYPTTPINDRKSMFEVLRDGALKSGNITCFDVMDDEFRMELTKSEVEARLYKVDTSETEDPETGNMIPAIVRNDINSDAITKYQLKEDWFYDRQRSVLDVRIIGLEVIKARVDDNGTILGDQALFWVYFPEIRPVIATQEVYMRHNDAERRTFDDIFWKRMFSSYVVKESNVYDRFISEYTTGMNALFESDRIKDEIFKLEHDLWHF